MKGGLPRDALSAAAEAVVVALASAGDDEAFGELVRRRQSQIRELLRRLSRDPALADDLAQQTFVQAWRTIRTLEAPAAFGGWLRKVAINIWLQHVRTVRARSGRAERWRDGTRHGPADMQADMQANGPAGGPTAGPASEPAHGPPFGPAFGLASGLPSEPSHEPTIAEQIDLDRALALVAPDVRLCIVLAYGERMSHREISDATRLPLGTVKSHIARGASRLRELLRAYG